MIVSKGGKNIYPGPIEEQFVTSPLIDQIVVVGEGREFLTVLVVPDIESLSVRAHKMGVDDSELLVHPYVNKLFAEPFTVENDLLTPTMKLKRKAIEHGYADLVEEMYSERTH